VPEHAAEEVDLPDVGESVGYRPLKDLPGVVPRSSEAR
jgi:hypothetical protein